MIIIYKIGFEIYLSMWNAVDMIQPRSHSFQGNITNLEEKSMLTKRYSYSLMLIAITKLIIIKQWYII